MRREPIDVKEALVEQIRSLSKRRSGPASSLDGLDDQSIYRLYSMLKSGETNRTCARWLIKGGLTSSVDSTGNLIARFRKRIAPLLVGNGRTLAPAPLPEPLPEDATEIEKIDRMTARYQRVIDRELLEAESGAALPQALSRHVAALTNLLKQRSKMQADGEKVAKMRARSGLTDNENAQLQGFIDGMSDDTRAVMVQASKNFIAKLKSGEIKTVEIGPDGKIIQ